MALTEEGRAGTADVIDSKSAADVRYSGTDSDEAGAGAGAGARDGAGRFADFCHLTEKADGSS